MLLRNCVYCAKGSFISTLIQLSSVRFAQTRSSRMPNTQQELLNKIDFFQSQEGILVGTVFLAVLWLILVLLDKYGRRIGPLVARSIRRPLLLGFSSALYLGWLLHLLELQAKALLPIKSSAVSTALVVIALGWATINLGRALLLQSNRIQLWLKVEDPRDEAMLTTLLDRVFTIGVIVLTIAALMVTFGVSTAAVGALLGGAGIGLGFGTQQISQNFLAGFMLFFTRPFSEGDWISVSSFDDGTVEKIGWYHTRIRTFDRRPLYIPNSIFATTPIENPGRMYNRRIKASISLRYEDLPRIEAITKNVRSLLLNHPDIDQKQSILVNFNEWDSSSINMMVYCFTKTTVWKDWLDIQQEVFLQIADIVQKAGGDFAFNCATLYPAPNLNDDNPISRLGEDLKSNRSLL